MPGKLAPAQEPPGPKPPLWQLRIALQRLASRHSTAITSAAALKEALDSRLCELEVLHVVLLLVGLAAGGGLVPGAALGIGWVGLALGVFPGLDARALWRRERRFVASCSREMVLATLAIYVDSVATYMVAVMHEHRGENIRLQDNVRILLMALCRACPGLETTFLRLPMLNAEEALFHASALGLFAAARGNGGFSLLAVIARSARALRWCRLLRVACFASTVMPSQTINCFMNRFDETYSTAEHWQEAFAHWRSGGGCNDLIFSGHLVILSLCALLHAAHSRAAGATGGWLPALIWCRVAHAALRIVHSQWHMSVDLIVSLVVTCLVWHVLPPLQPGPAEKGARLGDEEEDLSDLEELSVVPPRLGSRELRFMCGDKTTRGWLVALLLTAVVGFGLLATDANQAGPISAYNRQRLRLVSVAGQDGDRGPGSLAQMQERPRPRLYCAMLHIEQGASVRKDYAEAVAATWGRRCDGLLLWDERRPDIEPLDAEAALSEPPTDSPRTDRWLRARRMWRYIGRHALPRYDWFVGVDDGGFVIAENLQRALAALEGGQESQRPRYLVNRGSWAPWGYVLNRAAVAELLQAMDGKAAPGAPGGVEACPLPSRAASSHLVAEYQTVANCLQQTRGIQPTAWEQEPRVRKALGCHGDNANSVLDLKSREDPVRLCQHVVLAFMVPRPSWVTEIFQEIYGSKAGNGTSAEGRERQGERGAERTSM